MKPKNKPKHKTRLLPRHMLMSTRVIVGLVCVTVIAVGMSLAVLARPAQVEPLFIGTMAAPTVLPRDTIRGSPTAIYMSPDGQNDGRPAALREELYGYAAGTLVRITSTWFEGWERWYSVVVYNGTGFDVRESQLEPVLLSPASATPVPPSSQFAHLANTGLYWLITTDPVAEIPQNTRVRVDQAWFDRDSQSWMYTVAAYNSTISFTAYEWELMYAPESPPLQLT